jgi:hypothetical protein
MFMKAVHFLIVILLLQSFASSAFAFGEMLFRSTDPLAQRDEWGILTQPPLNPTDFEPRYRWRAAYYFQHEAVLVTQPAYVGALQTALRRKGYYSGPIDGVYSPEVGGAIARLQKAHAMRVNGTLTDAVRRALYLP